jgi:polysaccharide biosynthesis/export protein
VLKKYACYLIVLSLLSLLFSCASSPPQSKEGFSPETKMKEIETQKQTKAMNDRIMMGAYSSGRGPMRDYKVGSEDLLEISVFEDEKLNKTVRVSSQGNISLPLLGILRVKGLTASEVEREIRDLLAEKYFQDPHVTVFIKEYRSQRISVLGAVEKPSVYDISGQKTVLEALAMAGGLKEDASHVLFLIRPPRPEEEIPPENREPNQETAKTFVIDLDELVIKGNWALNMTLLNSDIINVPVSGRVFVGGYVKQPGGFPMKGKRVTVSQAIAMAGGLAPKADGSAASIFRFSEKDGQKETLVANIYEIEAGRDRDIEVKENDIVIVPLSGVKGFFIELRDTIKGLIGLGLSIPY